MEPPVGEKDDWEIARVVEVGGLRQVIVRVSRQEGTMMVDGRVRYKLDNDMTYSYEQGHSGGVLTGGTGAIGER